MRPAHNRVVITGVGLMTPLGHSFAELKSALFSYRSGVVAMPSWEQSLTGLATQVAAPVRNFDEKSFDRKKRRSMSRVSLLATHATSQAIEDAGLTESELKSPRTGISYGSSMGGTSTTEEYFSEVVRSGNFVSGVYSSTFLKIMSHTCAANLAVNFGVAGRVIASCTACAASTQSIGFAYENIKHGLADRMLCGGAEELTPVVAAVFDGLKATSAAYNQTPSLTPRPFSKDRDGLVVGEGAGTFILESLASAEKRGANIYAEVKGFCTNNDGNHMTNPSVAGMRGCMEGALADAGLKPADISYVNAHATATLNGDIAESKAVEELFGSTVMLSSTKGNFGHLLGAAGVTESAACLMMLQEDKVLPTLNLNEPDSQCGKADFVMNVAREHKLRYILKNSFAFGGINATLVLARMD